MGTVAESSLKQEFVNPTQLPPFCKKSGPTLLVLVDLPADSQTKSKIPTIRIITVIVLS